MCEDHLKLVYKLVKNYKYQTSEPNTFNGSICNENIYLLRKYFSSRCSDIFGQNICESFH